MDTKEITIYICITTITIAMLIVGIRIYETDKAEEMLINAGLGLQQSTEQLFKTPQTNLRQQKKIQQLEKTVRQKQERIETLEKFIKKYQKETTEIIEIYEEKLSKTQHENASTSKKCFELMNNGERKEITKAICSQIGIIIR